MILCYERYTVISLGAVSFVVVLCFVLKWEIIFRTERR